jgi:uncharacterized protein YlxW (UPF0749 family)
MRMQMEGKLFWDSHRLGFRLAKPARGLAVVLASTMLGFLLTLQIQSVMNRPPATPEYSRDLSAVTIQRLESEQKLLKDNIARLRGRLVAQQQSATSGASSLSALTDELDRQRLAAGLSTPRGPGVSVILDDSTKGMPAGDEAANYLIHDFELRDVASLLWLAGAEAVAINDERLVASTSIYCVGSTIIVNNTRLSPPYEIRALGNPSQLEEALKDPGTLKKVKSRAKLYGIQFKYAQVKEMTLPTFTGGFAIKYASPPGK